MSRLKHGKLVPSFEDFIALFPEEPLPITIRHGLEHEISKRSYPLNEAVVDKYLTPHGPYTQDDVTEYTPAFALPPAKEYVAIVLWKASLLVYEYHLITYNKRGEFVDSQVIGGSKTDSDGTIYRFAVIDEYKTIEMIEGEELFDNDDVLPANSKRYTFEIMDNGVISLLD